MANKVCGVYAIVSPTSRRYIGSSVNVTRRWVDHRRDLRKGAHHCRALQRAFDKYGEDAFSFVLLERTTPDAMLQREQAYFDANRGRLLYNSARTAGNCRGVKHTAETRAKLSALRKGRKVSNATREKLRELKTGMRYSDATKNKIRATLREVLTGKAKSTNTSGYAGVHLHKCGRWQARVRIDGRRYHVGLFDTPAEAHAAIANFKATN